MLNRNYIFILFTYVYHQDKIYFMNVQYSSQQPSLHNVCSFAIHRKGFLSFAFSSISRKFRRKSDKTMFPLVS